MNVVHKGTAGHFCGSDRCCFHLHSLVNGRWRVSTVGCWHPVSAGYGEPQPIGYQRLYETMVFDGDNDTEIEMTPYNDADAANRGHADTVARYLERAA